MSCDGSRTTSQHQQVIGMVSSLSIRRVAIFDSHDRVH
jgi:hypothetical protein